MIHTPRGLSSCEHWIRWQISVTPNAGIMEHSSVMNRNWPELFGNDTWLVSHGMKQWSSFCLCFHCYVPLQYSILPVTPNDGVCEVLAGISKSLLAWLRGVHTIISPNWANRNLESYGNHKCSGDGDPPINYDFSNAAWRVSPEWSSSYPYILLVTDPCWPQHPEHSGAEWY